MKETNIAKIVLDVLKDFDYKNVSQEQMKRIIGRKGVVGLTDFGKHHIYVVKDQGVLEVEQTQVHEFVHAYFATIGHIDATEELVERTACEWRSFLYGAPYR